MISVNMDKARQIHLTRIRAARADIFRQVDADRAIATDAGDQTALTSVKARATELRDVTKTAELTTAQTPEELKAVWPPCLAAAASLK
jgi:hypothetical protein